ncbi:MAG: hypothetical protein ACOX1Z_02120 [Candidatus Ratteibacteria bacterium]
MGKRKLFLGARFSEEFVLLGFARGKKKKGGVKKIFTLFTLTLSPLPSRERGKRKRSEER